MKLSFGGLVNFWYPFDDDPKERLTAAGVSWPADGGIVSQKRGLYCTVGFPGHDQAVLAAFATKLFAHLFGVGDAELAPALTKTRTRPGRRRSRPPTE